MARALQESRVHGDDGSANKSIKAYLRRRQ